MTEKIKKLFEKRNKLKLELETLKQEQEETKENSKKFNKTLIKLIFANVALMIPMALYTIPIIPTTYYLAGVEMKTLAPILSKAASLDLLMYSAFVGGIGFATSTATLILGNLIYFIPLKIFIKKYSTVVSKKKREINDTIIEDNIRNIYGDKKRKQNSNSNSKYRYSYKKKQSSTNSFEEALKQSKEKKRKLKR